MNGFKDKLTPAEETSRAGDERFRLAIGAAGIGIWDYKPSSGELVWDERVREYFGAPPDSVPSWDLFIRTVHADDVERVLRAVEDCYASVDGSFRCDYRINRIADGVERWISARGKAFFDASGAVDRFIGTAMDATERKGAETALHRSEARQRFLADLSECTQALADPYEIMDAIAAALGTFLAVDRCAYAEVEADGDHFNLTGNYTCGVPSITGRYAFSDFGDAVLRLMRDNAPFISDDVERDLRLSENLSAYRQTQIQAVICVPLHKAGKLVAAMAVHQKDGRRWKTEEIELVRLVANRCWESIERARVSRGLKESEQRHRFLAELGMLTRPLTDPEDIMAASARALGRYLRADRCAYAEVEPDQDHFIVTSDYTDDMASIVGRHTFSQFGDDVAQTLRQNRPYILYDSDDNPRLAEGMQRYGLTRVRAVVVVPLHKENKLAAVMSVHQITPRRWRSDEIELVRQVAGLSWETIERARVTRRLAEQARRMELLNRTGTALAAELNLERLLQTVTDAAVELTGAQFGAFFYNVMSDDEEAYTLYTLSGAPKDAFAAFPMPRNTAIFGPTFRAEGIVRSDDILLDPRYGQSGPYFGMPEGHLPVRSYLALPVISRFGEVIGGLFFGHADVAVFNENCELIAKGIAAQAAIAVDNAKLYQASRKAEHSLRQLLAAHERHQLALAESEARLRIAAEAARLGIFEWVVPDNVVHWENDRMYEIFGREKRDGPILADEFFASIVHPDDAETYRASFAQGHTSGGVVDTRCRIRRCSDQAERWLHFIGTFDIDERGMAKRFIGTVADVTELQSVEDERKLADRRKDEFLAVLAHELRNPLAPLRNAIGILQTEPDNASVRRRSLQIMERQLTQMVRLIDDLLDISRISVGKIELRKEHATIQDIINNALEIARPLIEKRGHRLELHVPETPIALHVDKTRMAQVLSNLLNNAAKYTEPNGHIRLSAGQEADAICVTVRDSGIGIAPAMLDRVFEMFTQLERSTEQSQGGLGVGLTLAKRLVELHKGSLHAHSRGPGTGSEFVLRLPIMPAAPSGAEPALQARGATTMRRILVVDDNVDAAESLAELLRLDGHQVETAYHGVDALKTMPVLRPEIVLLDIGMPSLDGYEIARRIRTLPAGSQITLIAATGWGQAKDIALSKQAGFDYHLVKPIDLSQLRQLLQ